MMAVPSVERFKMGLSIFGLVDCMFLCALGFYIFVEMDSDNLFTVAYSFAQSLLFAGAGAFVGIVEAKTLCKTSSTYTKRFSKFVMNKLGLVIFYFWIGALAMGGKNYATKEQKYLGRATDGTT